MEEFELRARDLERASREDPSVLERGELLGLMADETWSVRMHLCRMFPRVAWPPEEYREVRDYAFEQASFKNAFVRAWALNCLAAFARRDEEIRPRVLEMIEHAMENEPPSVRVCARKALKTLTEEAPRQVSQAT
ncbi:MAG TPA: hypothetical protein VMI31_19190 [Fimbriimonadaceae bacterium]|nr:hypothetical protein [Fimbriimonadaceae bacterium]